MENKKKKRDRTPMAMARYAAGYTQAEMAEVIGVTAPTVHMVECRPQDCSDKTVLKFIDALPGDTEYLKKWVFDVKMRKRQRELEKSFGKHARL